MKYKVIINEDVTKFVENLTNIPIKRKIANAIIALGNNPRPASCKKLKGKLTDYYRIRTGNYRVLYTIADKILLITVIKIAHSTDVYR